MTAAAPPPSQPPAPSAHLTLDAWWRPARLVGVACLAVVGVTAPVLASYYGTDGKASRALEVAQQSASSAKAAADAVVQLRTDTERQAREYQQATNARLEALARERAEDREAMVRVQEQLRALSGQVGDMRGDVRVLLDRLNASPRGRTARDYQ